MLLHKSLRMRAGNPTGKNILLFLIMGIVALLMISPVLWLISASFQNEAEIFQTPFNWLPSHLLWHNYVDAWVTGNLGGAFLNSVEVTLLYVPIHVFVCTITGYVFAKFHFRGRNLLFTFILLTLLIPQEVTYFAVYGIVRDLGWLNTPQGVALPFFYSGFGVFFMRQCALAVPDEVLEAAKMDGASDARAFFQVVLPLLEPGMIALAILALTFIWSEFTWSHLVLSTNSALTLPIALYNLTYSATVDNAINYTVLLAGSVIALVPVLLLFLVFQRRFIEGIGRAGIRG